jgi:ABC-2 type transport system permease protein
MTSALLYLQWMSLRNRLVTQVRRLKQPKYLFGAIVSGLYFYFYFFRYLFHAHGGAGALGNLSPDARALWEAGSALLLFTVILLAWIIPHERSALIFTEAEIAFLFPAPIRRSGLVHFKLIRSQVRIFLTAFFLTLFTNRFGGNAWIHALGWWFVFSTLNLHFLGCSFGRTMLLDRGISNWRRRLVIFALLGALVIAVLHWANNTIPQFELSRMTGAEGFRNYAKQFLLAGPVPYVLYPFRLIVHPFFCADAAAFLHAAGPALLIIGLHYVWVVRSDVRFEEASIEASQKMAARIAEMRAGNRQGFRAKVKRKRAPFRLRSTGFAPIALIWKNLISAGQMFSLRLWFLLAIVGATFVSASVVMRDGPWTTYVGMICAMFLPWSLLFGPQIMRQDLRQDLAHADVLKTFPLPGWQVVLGEVLAPAAILTGVQWLLLIFSLKTILHLPKVPYDWTLTIAAGFALLLPVINLVLLLIPNAGVLFFPAWFQVGRNGPQGIEATGQRLIIMFGQLLAFVVTLIPAAIFFAIVFFLAQLVMTPVLSILPASAIAAIVLAGEAFAGVVALGKVFERFDLSAELNS